MTTLTSLDPIDVAFELTKDIDAILPKDWHGGASYEYWGDETECWRCYKVAHGNYDYYQFCVSSKGKFYGFIPDAKVLMDVIKVTQKYQKYYETDYGKELVSH